MHDIVFSMNIAGGDVVVQGVLSSLGIMFGAAHQSLRRAITCHVRIFLPGSEVVRSWQVLL